MQWEYELMFSERLLGTQNRLLRAFRKERAGAEDDTDKAGRILLVMRRSSDLML